MLIFQPRHDYLSWGRVNRFTHHVATPAFQSDAQNVVNEAITSENGLLPYGCGRSYGDSCLNDKGQLLDTQHLDHFISFDQQQGILECESGVTLAGILSLLERQSTKDHAWFLPVTPGTKFVTVGGAIANDVHGKNHHDAGCWGNHTLSFQVLRSNGKIYTCSPSENTELFQATIGGLGLTGLILSCRIKLKSVPGFWLETEDLRYNNIDEFFELADSSTKDWEYTVAWIDCLARGHQLGRGIFSRARHTASPFNSNTHSKLVLKPKPSMFFDLPSFSMNKLTISAFNALYWRKIPKITLKRIQFYEPVFYPLDAIGNWNYLYGKRGFFQYQCAIPQDAAHKTIPKLLETISKEGEGSFLAVLKTLGHQQSPGMLSFPLYGSTLALDFPNRGAKTLNLLKALDKITLGAGGRVYCAKDGRMSAQMFQNGYPHWRDFSQLIDPHFSSSFWRRVSKTNDKGVRS